MDRQQDPGIYRRRIRSALRQARERLRRTQQETADALDWSLSKIIRIETGEVNISVSDLRALLAYYEVADQELAKELITAARLARGKPWWHPYLALISKQFIKLLTYEVAATTLRAYHPSIINGLLTTPDYTRALREQMVDCDKLDELLEFLAQRQKVLFEDVAPEATFIIDESALYRRIGGLATMIGQLSHLREMAARERVTIKIFPYEAGANRSLNGPFILANFAKDSDSGVTGLYLEGRQADVPGHTSGSHSSEERTLTDKYEEIFKDLDRRSLSEADSDRLLAKLIGEYQRALTG